MKKITGGTAVLQDYSVYELSGIVESESTRSETEVSGHMPSRNSNMAGHISSKTTQYQTIYMKCDKGQEHALQLIDFIIPCREGHRLTVWGVNQGSWFSGINHSTEQSYNSKIPLTNFTMPFKIMKRTTYAICIVLFLIFSGVMSSIDVSFVSVLWGGLGAVICGLFIYALLLIPGKITSVIRTSQIISAKEQYAST